MQAVELFAGIGLSACGVVDAGFELVRGLEIERNFVRAFNGQHPVRGMLPPVCRREDVGAARPLECDVVCAGPVCKAFSPGATVFGTDGVEDSRNTFPHMMRYVESARPRYLLIENSFGLRRLKYREYLQQIQGALATLGYYVECAEVDCYDFGVPQHRRRVVITASRTSKIWHIPKGARIPEHPKVVGDVMYEAPPDDPWPLLSPLSPKALEYWNRDPRHAKKHPPLRMDQAASTVVSVYRKGVPYGVVEHEGRLWHCMPRLAARLQGLSDRYDLRALSKTAALEGIGNGFPPPVVRTILEALPA